MSDGKGGTASASLTVVVTQANRNPTVVAARNPTTDVVTGQSIAFSATASDPDGDPVTYAWDFGDGGTAIGQNVSRSYAAPGTYTARITVSDGKGGTATDTVGVTVTQANRNPTVTISRTPTGDVVAGTAIAFTATGTDADGDTLTYAWDFGDSSSSTTQNPSKTYAAAGAYTVRVTVSDGKGGTGTTTVPVTILAPSCGTGSGFRDDFNGTGLGAGWSVIRGDSALTVGNGVLSIPTQAGDLYQTANTAKNMVLRPGPRAARSRSWPR